MNGIKANIRIRVEQDVDLVLKNMKLKVLGQQHDEVLLMTVSRYKHYKANEDRLILKDGLLFRKNFGERVMSNTSKFSSEINSSKKSSAPCMENLESTQELPKQ